MMILLYLFYTDQFVLCNFSALFQPLLVSFSIKFSAISVLTRRASNRQLSCR